MGVAAQAGDTLATVLHVRGPQTLVLWQRKYRKH